LFPRRGGHQAVEAGAPWDGVGERHQRPAKPQKAVTRLGVGDVAHLCIRNTQQLGQFGPVSGGLVEQQQKFTVGQHEPRRLGLQALLHILSRRRHDPGILPKAFPRPVEKFAGVVVFEVQIALINEYPGKLAPLAVLHDAVLDNGNNTKKQGKNYKFLPCFFVALYRPVCPIGHIVYL